MSFRIAQSPKKENKQLQKLKQTPQWLKFFQGVILSATAVHYCINGSYNDFTFDQELETTKQCNKLTDQHD